MLKIATLLLLLQVATPTASQQSGEKASVEGIILRSGTGEPLGRAQVTLYRALSREEFLETFREGEIPDANAPSIRTGNDGTFLLKDVNPGAYRLTVTHNGYAEQTYGQKIIDGPSTIFNLAPGQSVKNITVRMVQAGVITGRVRDASGELVGRWSFSDIFRLRRQRWKRSFRANRHFSDRRPRRVSVLLGSSRPLLRSSHAEGSVRQAACGANK